MPSKVKGEGEVRIRIRKGILESIFDECDLYEDRETGGRLIGTLSEEGGVFVEVAGVIDAGPRAKRTRSSLFQDGNYQYNVFREIEGQHPEVEHLGTWHTHHVNGHPGLSGGDIATYHRIVNHPKHNTGYLYALLVQSQVGGPARYTIRHFLFRRNEERLEEVPERSIEIVDSPVMWVPPVVRRSGVDDEEVHGRESPAGGNTVGKRRTGGPVPPRRERELDDRVLRRMFPELRPYLSKSSQVLHWKGGVTLLDGATVAVLVAEGSDDRVPSYSAMVTGEDRDRVGAASSQEHDTPWMAVREIEQILNRRLLPDMKGRCRGKGT